MITIKTTKLGAPCGFCTTGDRHDLCPGGVLNGNGTEVVLCGCKEHPVEYRCLECNERDADLINPDTWACLDQDACRTRRDVAREKTLRDLYGGETGSKASGPSKVAKTPEKAPARAKEGKCLHCGEPTKGGLFLPGHDARYLRDAAIEVTQGRASLHSTVSDWQDKGVSPALQAKLIKRVSA